jgi:hypothetical protein
VVDSAAQDAPATGAEVRLTPTDSLGALLPGATPTPRMRVDSSGIFAFRALAAGIYRVDVRRLGYEPFEGYLVLPPDRELRPRVPLTKMVPMLARVTTTAHVGYRSRLLEINGFRARQRSEVGRFVDSKQLAALQSRTVRDVIAPYAYAAHGCMLMWVNGALTRLPPGLLVSELVGIEIYTRYFETPARFRTSNDQCGSIVVWTAIPDDEPEADEP